MAQASSARRFNPRMRVLLASSSLAALLVAGGAPAAFAAACTHTITASFDNPSGDTTANVCVSNTSFTGSITNEGTISPSGIAFVNGTITGNISSTGIIAGGISLDGKSKITTATGAAIFITGPSFAGGIDNSGTISAGDGKGIVVGGSAAGTTRVFSTFSGGISNSGTISASSDGILVGGTAEFGTLTVSAFSGGISNSGTISAGSNGILVGGTARGGTLTIATFSDGISNSGTISAGGDGIRVGGDATLSAGLSSAASVTISTFAGGITNSGTISAGSNGILVGGTAQGGTLTIATFSDGISNSSTISAGGDGIRVGGDATLSAGHSSTASVTISTFAGGITNSGAISAGGNGILVGGNATVSSTGAFNAASVTIAIFAGGITNSGAISAGGAGILVGGDATVIGGVDNTASVTIATFASGISNSGTISAAGNGIMVGGDATVSAGIVFTASVTIATFAGGISNSGAISAGGDGILVGGDATVSPAVGLAASSVTIATFAGGISNSGTISAAGNGIMVGGTATASGDLFSTASVTIATFADGISNSGTISAAGDGILIGGAAFGSGGSLTISTFAGGIFNSGTIVARGAGIFLGATTVSAVSINSFAGGISNSGTIIARTGIVFGLAGVDSFSGAIVNSGTISGTGGTAIDIENAPNAITIDQTAGLISGDIVLSAHADVLNISGGTINGDIAGGGGVATQDTINFTLGSGTFTYGAAYGFTTINQVNINSGTVILDGESNANTTTVYGGDLQIGDAANPGALLTSTVAVDGGILSGHGTIAGAVTVGGLLEPGTPGVAGGKLTVNGNLVFTAAAEYMVNISPSVASFTVVNGKATLNGMLVLSGTGGNYVVGTKYDILSATGGLSGTTFSSVDVTGSFGATKPVVSYDDVYVTLVPAALTLPPGATVNQINVANAINGVNNGNLPPGFSNLFNLTPLQLGPALNQIDGEDATGAQVGAFQLDDQFLNLMLNPFVNGRGYAPGAPGAGSPLGFAPDRQADLPDDVALAYASILGKAPPKASFDQRWSVWGEGYGGSGTDNGDPTGVGSTNITASTYGYAAGMDYHALPNTIVGFALAGGGTNWDLANALGTGRSDALQAGAYGITWRGPAYLAGSLAFGNYWFNTDRAALGDQLTANFIGQSYSARFEGGYRYAVLPTLGVTPYAAVEMQDFHSPSYSETDLTGGGFGLAYNALSATDVRTELGARFDAPTLAYGKPLVLYGRLAWAHDFVNDPSLTATFETLPGSGFTVFGAPIAHDSALASAGAQLFLTANWSLIGTFNGQFASGSQTYEGSGTLRYTW